MQQVTVRVRDLQEVVQTNRDQHRAIFEEALEGYKARAIELLQDHIDRIQSGSVEQVRVILPQPVDHTKEYDQVLSMLEMTTKAGTETIELDRMDYARYVLDDWDWKEAFLATNQMYAASLQ